MTVKVVESASPEPTHQINQRSPLSENILPDAHGPLKPAGGRSSPATHALRQPPAC